jgi:hypothetical protein
MGAPLPPSDQAIPPTLPIVATNQGGAHC